jgi:peptidoglycan/xylan/chitin deacetylase (PgdA/CDA1 family)
MLQQYLTRTKIIFTVAMFAWLAFIVITTYNNLVQKNVALISRELNYIRYKTELQTNTDLSLKSVGAVIFSSLDGRPEQALATSTESAPGIPVLVYHGLVEVPDRFSTTPELFKDQMFALRRAGYQAVRLSDFIAFIKGEKTLPEKSFLLTFDDGRTVSYQQADPILKALGWSAVMFVATDQSLSDKKTSYYLKEGTLREMQESGRWEIQSHAAQSTGGFVTVNEAGDPGNFLSNKAWIKEEQRFETDEEYLARINAELGDSKARIEELIGNQVTSFSYPFSDYGQQTINAESISEVAIRDTLSKYYKVAFRQTYPQDSYFTLNYVDEDPYRLRRFETPSSWDGSTMVRFMNQISPKDLPYVDSLSFDNGWKSSWGHIQTNQNGLNLVASPETAGAFAFLDGTRTWGDYSYIVEAMRSPENYITLYSRYQSNDNYVACVFGDNDVRIEQRVEGRTTSLANTSKTRTVGMNTSYGMYVEGDYVECRENAQTVATGRGIDDKISYGGIGLRAWDENVGQSSVTFSNLRVSPINSN